MRNWRHLNLRRREPRLLRRLRGYRILDWVREACRESIRALRHRESPHSAAEIVVRALENFPDLGVEVAREALSMEGYWRDLLLDMVALRAPGSVLEALDYNVGMTIFRAHSIDISSAPSVGVELYTFLLKHYRRLAREDERFLPQLAETLNNLGLALSYKGRLEEAIGRYEEALEYYRRLAREDERFLPYVAGTLNNLGNALRRKNEFDEAIEKYREALSYVPHSSNLPWHRLILAESHAGLGLAFLAEGDPDLGTAHLCNALDFLLYPRPLPYPDARPLLEDCVESLLPLRDELDDECRKRLERAISLKG